MPAGYTVTEGLSANIAAGAQDTFTVRLNATAAGTYPGDVSFTNNDSNENPFNFRITGCSGRRDRGSGQRRHHCGWGHDAFHHGPHRFWHHPRGRRQPDLYRAELGCR